MSYSKLAVWATTVKNRDGKCLHCGSENDLHAHHKMPKSTHPELSLDLDNGMTLCYRCHKKEHEKNRPTKPRTGTTPHRTTLMKQIKELQERIIYAEKRNVILEERIKELFKQK